MAWGVAAALAMLGTVAYTTATRNGAARLPSRIWLPDAPPPTVGSPADARSSPAGPPVEDLEAHWFPCLTGRQTSMTLMRSVRPSPIERLRSVLGLPVVFRMRSLPYAATETAEERDGAVWRAWDLERRP